LTHYVRYGDFIVNLIRESQDIDEYAFALGALSHYAADNDGHRMAVNVSVPLLYPKLRVKFGSRATYADDRISHTKTEFGFDVTICRVPAMRRVGAAPISGLPCGRESWRAYCM
jgi:hypothetical protein